MEATSVRSSLILGLAIVLLASPSIFAGTIKTNPPLWVSRGEGIGESADVAVAPDGARVYAAGQLFKLPLGGFVGETGDGLLRALDPTTGAPIWQATRDNGGFNDMFSLVTASPSGATVYVVGRGDGLTSIVAYDADDGALSWATTRDIYGQVRELAAAGGRLFLSYSPGNQQAAVDAFDAATGAYLWTSEGDWGDYTTAPMTVAGDGNRVYVGGGGWNAGAVVALDGATGAVVWSTGWLSGMYASVSDVVLSPDGSRVFAVGAFWQSGTGFDLAFASINTATGAEEWTSTYSTPAWEQNGLASVAPAGWLAIAAERGEALLVLRIDPATGGVAWVTNFVSRPLWYPQVEDIVVAGDRVVVTSLNYVDYPSTEVDSMMGSAASTVAFEAGNGALSWRFDFDTPAIDDRGTALAKSPDGSRVFATVAGTGPVVASYLASGPP